MGPPGGSTESSLLKINIPVPWNLLQPNSPFSLFPFSFFLFTFSYFPSQPTYLVVLHVFTPPYHSLILYKIIIIILRLILIINNTSYKTSFSQLHPIILSKEKQNKLSLPKKHHDFSPQAASSSSSTFLSASHTRLLLRQLLSSLSALYYSSTPSLSQS